MKPVKPPWMFTQEASALPQLEPGQLPGVQPGGLEAAMNPMAVGTQQQMQLRGVNPYMDPAVFQNLIGAQSGLQQFSAFATKNMLGRLDLNRRVTSFVRAHKTAFYGPSSPLRGDLESDDIFIPVYEDEDKVKAVSRFAKEMKDWEGMWPQRLASKSANLLPNVVTRPMGLTSLRERLDESSPIYNLRAIEEQMSTAERLFTPDWTWLAFGAVGKYGGMGLRAIGARLAADAGIEVGIATSGLGKLAESGVLNPASLSAMGKPSTLTRWLGEKVGARAYGKIKPGVLLEAEEALTAAGGSLHIDPYGTFRVVLPSGTAAAPPRLRAAMQALKMEMTAAGQSARMQILRGAQGIGLMATDAAAGASTAALAYGDAALFATPEQRRAMAAQFPTAVAEAAAIPAAIRGAMIGVPLAYQSLQGIFDRATGGDPLRGARNVTPGGGPGVSPNLLGAPPRLLGEVGQIRPPGPRRSGPFGPTTPDPGIYGFPFPEVPAPALPTSPLGGPAGVPSGAPARVQVAMQELTRILPMLEDSLQMTQVQSLVQALAGEQAGVAAAVAGGAVLDAGSIELRNRAVASRLETLTKVAGKDSRLGDAILGVKLMDVLLAPMMVGQDMIQPQKDGMVEWAQGLAEQAARSGVDLQPLLVTLPPPAAPEDLMTMAMRLKGVSDFLATAAPLGPVGPPETLSGMPAEVSPRPPVVVSPIPGIDLLDPLETGSFQQFPEPEQLRLAPREAALKQVHLASSLASGLSFLAGTFEPRYPLALNDVDPIQVPVYQDEAGRLMARVPSPDGEGEVGVEVTTDLTRAALPRAAGWQWIPNVAAAIPYRFDEDRQILSVDKAAFPETEWVRNVHKQALVDQISGNAPTDPLGDVTGILQTIQLGALKSVSGTQLVLDRLDQLQREHENKRPTEDQAVRLLGPNPAPETVRAKHAEMISDHFMMGALLDQAKSDTLAAATKLSDRIDQLTRPDIDRDESIAIASENTSDVGNLQRKYLERRGPEFFFKALQMIVDSPQKKWEVGQLFKYLKGRGVKDVELEVIGLKHMLEANVFKGKSATKEDILRGMQEPLVQTVEQNDDPEDVTAPNTSYREYTLKGGSHYSELLLTMDVPPPPTVSPTESGADEWRQNATDRHGGWGDEAYGLMAWTRVKTRKGADNERVIFAEEFQDADWLRNIREKKAVTPPNAFAEHWQELLLKRLVLEAVARGGEAIAWTTGAQQQQRWSLAKVLDNLKWVAYTDTNNIHFEGRRTNGNYWSHHSLVPIAELENYVGADVAKAIRSDMAGGLTSGNFDFGDQPETFGGRWATHLYDQLMPSLFNKLARQQGWKTQVRTGQVQVGLPTPPREIRRGPGPVEQDHPDWDEIYQRNFEHFSDDYFVGGTNLRQVTHYYIGNQDGERIDLEGILQELFPGHQASLGPEFQHWVDQMLSPKSGRPESEEGWPYNDFNADEGWYEDKVETLLERIQEHLVAVREKFYPGAAHPELNWRIVEQEEDSEDEDDYAEWGVFSSNGYLMEGGFRREQDAQEAEYQLIHKEATEGAEADVRLTDWWTTEEEEREADFQRRLEETAEETSALGPMAEVWYAPITPEMRKAVDENGIALLMAREGGRAKASFDPRLVQVLGQNTYKGQIAKIMVKEMFQNAHDALNAAIDRGWAGPQGPFARCKVEYDHAKGLTVATFEDNGIGMSPEVATKEFVDIGGSYKPGQQSAGGFGIAKVAFLGSAQEIHLTTVADTPQGRIRSQLFGSGQDWMDFTKGLEAPDPEPVGDDVPTGTSLRIAVKHDDFNPYEVQGFVAAHDQYSSLPYAFEFQQPDPNFSRPSPVKRNFLRKLTADDGSWEADVYASEAVQDSSGSTKMAVLNSGLFQFEKWLYHGFATKMPSVIILDVKPRVRPEEPGYPFQTDRESLREVLENPLIQYVRTSLAADSVQREKNKYRQTFEQAPSVGGGPDRLVDSEGVVSPGLILQMTQSPAISQVSHQLSRLYLDLQDNLSTFDEISYDKKKMLYGGIGVSRAYLGINILGSVFDRKDNVILQNIFAERAQVQKMVEQGFLQAKDGPRHLAEQMVWTALHELTHEKSRNHDAPFANELTYNGARTMAVQQRWQTKLELMLEGVWDDLTNLTDKLNAEWAALPAGEDVFGKVGASSTPGSPPGGDPLTPGVGAGRGRRPGEAVPGGSLDPSRLGTPGANLGTGDAAHAAAQAQLRADAKQRAALGRGWSGTRNAKLFAVLTDDERADALQNRLNRGPVRGRANLEMLDPTKWETSGKYPKYFGSWRPTPDQMKTLKQAYADRLARWNTAEANLGKLKAIVAARKPGAVNKTVPQLSLEALTSLDPTQVEEIFKDGALADEWARQVLRDSGPVSQEVASEPDVQRREKLALTLQLLKDAARTWEDETVLTGPHPSTEGRIPWGGVKRLMMDAHMKIKTAKGGLRMHARPSMVLGIRKQIQHPSDFTRLGREVAGSAFWQLYRGSIKVDEEMLRVYNDFRPLSEAARKDEVLDRAIMTFLEHGTPPEEIRRSKFAKQGGVDVATWVDKLRKFDSELISQAEQSLIGRYLGQAAQYKNDGQLLEIEMRARELKTAREVDPEIKTWEQIPVDLLKAIRTTLSQGDKGDATLGPALGMYPYASLKSRHGVALRKYREAHDELNLLRSGAYRNENSVSYIHRQSVHEVRKRLRDSQSVFSLFTPPEVKNHYLGKDAEEGTGTPYRSWSVGWLLYIPTMLRTIHLEPALRKSEPLIKQLPSDMQFAATHFVQALKGIDPMEDQIFNRLAMESWAEEPSLLTAGLKKLGGPDLIDQIKKDPEARHQLVGSRRWTELGASLAGLGYAGFMLPLKVASQTMVEPLFLLRELIKEPRDVAMAPLWALYGQGAAGGAMLREFGSWMRGLATKGPRWYSEPTYLQVTEGMQDIATERTFSTTFDRSLHDLQSKVTTAWYAVMRSTEYYNRAATYYTLKQRALHWGMSDDDAKTFAAMQTNDLVGAFGPRESSGYARGAKYRLWWMFKRFPWAKTELFLDDASNALRLVGGPQPSVNLSAGDRGGAAPPPPNPPNVGGSAFGDWTPEESGAWTDHAHAAGEFGSSMPTDRTAQVRGLLGMLGWAALLYPTIGLAYLYGKAFFDEDTDLFKTLMPLGVTRMGDIPLLSHAGQLQRFMVLETKKNAPFTGGLSKNEERELKQIKKRLTDTLAYLGPILRMLEDDDDTKKKSKGPAMPQMPSGGKMPSMPRMP